MSCGSCRSRRFGGKYRLHRLSEKKRRARIKISSNKQPNHAAKKFLLLVILNVIPSTPILATLMIEAIRSSETSILTRATRHNIPEEDNLQRVWCWSYWANPTHTPCSVRIWDCWKKLIHAKSHIRQTRPGILFTFLKHSELPMFLTLSIVGILKSRKYNFLETGSIRPQGPYSNHQRKERDPVSETLCFLVFIILNDGQSPETQ
jgi:hypothetical protein